MTLSDYKLLIIFLSSVTKGSTNENITIVKLKSYADIFMHKYSNAYYICIRWEKTR